MFAAFWDGSAWSTRALNVTVRNIQLSSIFPSKITSRSAYVNRAVSALGGRFLRPPDTVAHVNRC